MLLVLCLVIACKKPKPAIEDETMERLIEWGEKMCRCTDAACAARVNDEIMAWSRDRNFSPSPELVKKAKPIAEKYTACLAKAMEVVDDTAPPPPPPPPQWHDALARVTALKTKMCACTDRICAQVVTAEFARLEKALEPVTITEDKPKELHLAYLATLRCAMTAGTGFGLAELPE